MKDRILQLAKVTAVALLAVFIAAVIRAFFHHVFQETIPYTPFYPAIIVGTMYGRLTGGFIATIAAAFAASFWIYPYGQLLIQQGSDLIGLALFLAVSGIVVALCEAMLRAHQHAEVAAAERQAALVREQIARRQAEEASRLKDCFVASVSHELRTPLQAILGWADLLGRSEVDEADRSRGLAVIERNARAQSRLIEDLLDMSRIVSGKMRLAPRLINAQNPIEAAIQTVAIAARSKDIAIERSYDSEASALLADPDRLQQIVWNLLTNSIKFSPPGSRIRVSLRRCEQEVHIEVEDQGKGIDPAHLESVFEQFRQVTAEDAHHHGGLGLGLSIVKHLAELHGGSARANSRGLGQGTTITVVLPSPDTTAGPFPTTPLTSPRGQLRGVRVLVVEDDNATCDLVRRILTGVQANVAVAADANAALAIAERFQPQVLVADIGLPGRDGNDLLRELHRREESSLHRLRALALTAYTSPEDQRRSYEAGYRLHMAKPVEPKALTDAVAELAAAGD